MPRVAIDVLLKREILDPQGRAVERALPELGYAAATGVRVGKHIELDVDLAADALGDAMERMCREFLTNPTIESFRWRVIDDSERADT